MDGASTPSSTVSPTITQEFKPIKSTLLYIGSKKRIIGEIIKLIPPVINDYNELFLGSGTVLLNVLEAQEKSLTKIEGNISAFDTDRQVIEWFITLQSNPEEVFNKINYIITEYNKYEEITNRKYFFESMLNVYNNITNDLITKSAIYIFIKKRAFNSIVRFKDNKLNAVFGRTARMKLLTNLDDYIYQSKLIKNVNFKIQDFNISLSNCLLSDKQNNFTYCDPPYFNGNTVGYTYEKFFTMDNHMDLYENLLKLKSNFMLSEGYSRIMETIFKDVNIKKVENIHELGRVGENRQNRIMMEMIITNYKFIK